MCRIRQDRDLFAAVAPADILSQEADRRTTSAVLLCQRAFLVPYSASRGPFSVQIFRTNAGSSLYLLCINPKNITTTSFTPATVPQTALAHQHTLQEIPGAQPLQSRPRFLRLSGPLFNLCRGCQRLTSQLVDVYVGVLEALARGDADSKTSRQRGEGGALSSCIGSLSAVVQECAGAPTVGIIQGCEMCTHLCTRTPVDRRHGGNYHREQSGPTPTPDPGDAVTFA